LLAQTFEEWECVVVDDGSCDDPGSLVAAVGDPRIRLIRLNRNFGAGFARQIALDEARGEFITMLDADDWLYPRKLELQLALLQNNPDLTAISCGMAILKHDLGLVGVRRRVCRDAFESFGPHKEMERPLLPFAPAMIRTRAARTHRFDAELRRAEDLAWLMKILPGCNYGIMPDVLYAYCEYSSFNPRKAETDLAYEMRVFASYRDHFPFAALKEEINIVLKSAIYRILRWCGLAEWAVKRRSISPSSFEMAAFRQAEAVIRERANAIFGSAVNLQPPERDCAFAP
jgi:glycosyltransferase involved in cell wall biosynthesis